MAVEKKPKASAAAKRAFAERDGKYMTLDEVADYFGVTPRKVDWMINRKEIRVTRIGKLKRIHVDDLAEYEARIRGDGAP